MKRGFLDYIFKKEDFKKADKLRMLEIKVKGKWGTTL